MIIYAIGLVIRQTRKGDFRLRNVDELAPKGIGAEGTLTEESGCRMIRDQGEG